MIEVAKSLLDFLTEQAGASTIGGIFLAFSLVYIWYQHHKQKLIEERLLFVEERRKAATEEAEILSREIQSSHVRAKNKSTNKEQQQEFIDRLRGKLEIAQSLKDILLVEDDARVRAVAGRLLREILVDASVDEAADGLEGQEKIEGGRFDFLITDIVMPRRSGVEMLANIFDQKRQIPTLVISGYASNVRDFIKRVPGAKRHVQFLSKPFSPDGLFEAIERTLRSAREEEAEGQ